MTSSWGAGNQPGDEPTRALDPHAVDQDDEWFWSRPQAEPTQVIPTEPTLQLPLAMSAAIGAAAASPSSQQSTPWPAARDGAGHAPGNFPAATPGSAQGQAPNALYPSAQYPNAQYPNAQYPNAQYPNAQYPNAQFPSSQQFGAAAPQRARSGTRGLVALFAASVLTGMAVLQAPGLVSSGSNRVPDTSSQPSAPQTQPTEQEEQDGTPAEQQPWDPWGQQGQSEQPEAAGEEESAGQTTASASQSKGVVLISTTTAAGQGAGSGMVITTNGHVLTNYHVVQSSTRVQVQVASTRKTYTATVVGHDASNDVALLKLEGADNLETVTIDDDELATGDVVTAVGNANGQGYLSAATGKVTDLASSITVRNESSASGSERLSDVIKTTAGAQPGDSGGPMIDDEGEVVGMTTAGQTASSGIRTQNTTIASYAVPIERALGIIQQIQAGTESGTVKIGPNAYLGVSVRSLDDGSLAVASVVSGGPAEQAGLGRGDVITSVGGAEVGSRASLSEQLATREPGDRVVVGWVDSLGEVHRATVTLGSSPVN
ncbi:trypsin-like peptidase domain-containing protein [Luteococcus sp. H138]|uniref:S1C family serine protease n=1 Tax=unclassified Luteococcus TaxID=2639923 RepID=UPI00313DF38A